MVEFISYDGDYPCLCMGTLKIRVDGRLYSLKHAMHSGGRVGFDGDWCEEVTQDEWSITLEEFPELEPYKDGITKVVNDNVQYGCCGGCV